MFDCVAFLHISAAFDSRKKTNSPLTNQTKNQKNEGLQAIKAFASLWLARVLSLH